MDMIIHVGNQGESQVEPCKKELDFASVSIIIINDHLSCVNIIIVAQLITWDITIHLN